MTRAARERWQVQAPLLLVTAAAWIALLCKPGGAALAGSCCSPKTLDAAFSSDSLSRLLTLNPPESLALGWGVMLAAMMAPLLAAPVRHVIDRSLMRRRVRAVALFLAGYSAMWMAAGVVIVSLGLVARAIAPKSLAPLELFLFVLLIWQCSPIKQRCLNRGHAHTALSAFGVRADLDALQFGVTHGFWCIGSCWALMLLPELCLTGHIAAMAVVTLWFVAERLERPQPPRWRLPGAGKAVRLVAAQSRILTPARIDTR